MKPATPPGRERTAPALTVTTEGLAWLGVALLMGGLGWWKSINLLLLLAYLMITLVALNAVLCRAHARRVRAAVEPSPPIYAGEDATVRLTATNTGTAPATASVEYRAADEPTAWLVNRLAPGVAAVCEGQWRSITRGRQRAAAVVSSGFPLGLCRYEHRDEALTDVVVLPPPGEADPDGLRRWVAAQVGGDGRARKVLRRVTTDQADVRGVRPYRPGDSIRTIHWRSSARRAELMVREYDAAPSPELVLVVEPWLPDDPSAADRAAFEGALSLAVTVARTWVRVYAARVVVAVAGAGEPPRSAAGSEVSLREALAPLADATGAPDHPAIEAREFDRSLARAARVVVSSRANTPYVDAMSAATGRRFVPLSPADVPPWYRAPGSGAKGRLAVRRRD